MADIDFGTIPLPFLPPLFYAEVQPGAAPFVASLKAMLVATPNTGVGFMPGNGLLNTPYLLSGSLARSLGGPGGMLHAMYDTFRRNSSVAEVWGTLVPCQPAGARAAGYFKVLKVGPKTAGLSVRIAGRRVTCSVRLNDPINTVAAKLRNAINAFTALPVVAALHAGDPSRVDVTCKWLGSSGNMIILEVNWFGKDDTMPQMLQVGAMTGGAQGFGWSPAQNVFNQGQWDVFASGYSGCLTIPAISEFMDPTVGRWSPFLALYGHWILANRQTVANLVTQGLANNEPHVSMMGITYSPTPEWEWASALAAHMTAHWATPPELSRPLQTLPIRGVLPPNDLNDAYTISEQQSLLSAGISTYAIDPSRNAAIQRIVTMRRVNDYGDPDPSWADAITMFQTQYFVRRMRQAITTAFPRAALSDIDTGIPGFASPDGIRNVYIHEYLAMQGDGLVENADLFAQSLVVQRNSLDANRVDSLIKPDFVNQLRIVAALVQTYLQSPVAIPTAA